MTLQEQFFEIYLVLNNPQNSFYVLMVFLLVALLALVVRILVCVGYQTELTLFRLNAKEIKTRADVKETRSQFLNRVIRDYLRIGDKGVSPRSAKHVTDKHISQKRFLGWSYDGMSAFAVSIERNIVFLGIILTVVFEDYRHVFAVGAVAAFLVLRLFATFFDFTLAKTRLSLEVSEYVDREIGQFYAGDSGSLILRLKNELSAAVLRQSESLSDSIKKMGNDLSGVLRLSLQEMSKSVDATMHRVSDFGGELSAPLESWKQAVGMAADAQTRFNSALSGFERMSQGFESSAQALGSELSGYTDALRTQAGLAKEEISRLQQVADGLKSEAKPLLDASGGIDAQLKYIARNQETLEQSLHRYELAMEEMTRRLGDGMGSIIEYHMQCAYGELNSALEDNIKQIITANNALAGRLQELFAQMTEQSRSETQAVLKIKEQMDLHFESLKQAR